MARARKTAKSKTNVSINFKGVESRRTPPEGDYVASVLEAENGDSSQGNAQIKWTLEISRGEYKGTKLWFYTPLNEQSLWKLHAWLTALGEEVPEDEVDIDLADLVGKELVVSVALETYQGKKSAKIGDFESLEDYEGDADLDEDDGKSKKKSKSKSKKDDDDEDDKPAKGKSKGKSKKKEAEDYEDLDEDELIEEYVKRKIGTKKAAAKLDEDDLREALIENDKEADDEDEEDEKPAAKSKGRSSKSKSKDEDEDEDEEDEKPKKGKSSAKSKKKVKKYDADDIDDMDEDELQETIDESGIDVDLDDYKGLKKQVAAVKKALEKADLIED